MRTERDIDEAIDRAVRDIMAVDPRAGLRARVLGRLSQPERSWFAFPRLAAGAALLAIVAVAAVVLLRTGNDPVPPPAETAKTEPAPIHLPAPEVPQAPGVSPRRSAAVESRRIERAAVFPPRGSVAAASLPGDATPAPPAGAPEATRDPEASALSPKPIAIEPVTIAPIVITPIRPPR